MESPAERLYASQKKAVAKYYQKNRDEICKRRRDKRANEKKISTENNGLLREEQGTNIETETRAVSAR